MISYQDKIKIEDFKNAFKKCMNPSRNPEKDKVIEDLFLNVTCNYDEYKSSVPYVLASQETYSYHVLKPVNGKYTLLDFLLNRAISNIDEIIVNDENSYDHSKILLINGKRYENKRKNYSDVFIERQYQKSRLHETGHVLHAYDTVRDGAIHCRKSKMRPNLVELKEKLAIFETVLGKKYPNMMHPNEIKSAPTTSHSSLTSSYPFRDHNLDEAATEYFATKYSRLYQETDAYKFVSVTSKPIPMAIAAPNHFNGYAHSSKFMYHLENLVSKSSMFQSRFFESDAALIEFSKKYSKEINDTWKKYASNKQFPNYSDDCPDLKFKYLFRSACNHYTLQSPESVQKLTYNSHNMLENIFALAYHKEIESSRIPKDKALEILNQGYAFSPIIFDAKKQGWVPSPLKCWYKDAYTTLEKTPQKNIHTPDEK